MNADKSRWNHSSRWDHPSRWDQEWDLPPERHLHFKDVLMQQIDQDRDQVHVPATGEEAAPAPRAPRRRLLRPAVLVPVASMALAGALVVTLSGGGQGSAPATGARSGGTAGASAPSTTASGASVTLDRIAVAAMASDATPVRDDQFVYVRSLTLGNEGTFDGPVRLAKAPHERRIWTPQDPGPLKTVGWILETGKGAVMPGQTIPIETTDAVPAGIFHPTYKWLASLPTDPGALLDLLYDQVKVADGESREQAVFTTIGDLVSETVMPPANAAALYRAAARIPGVTQISDAVDTAGRHGIAITREDARSATRNEWIFDRDTLAFLGSRSYITHDPTKGITSDTLYGSTAIMRRAVVDRRGEEPARAKS